MVEQKLTTYFSKYKRLTVRAEFLVSSKNRIAAIPQPVSLFAWRKRLLETITTGGALALSSVLLIVVLGGLSYATRQAGMMATGESTRTADTAALLREASQLTSAVHINEVEQFNESSEAVVMALNTIAQEEAGREQ